MTVPSSNRSRLVCRASNYFAGLASVLRTHRGILFPYTPTINYDVSVNYTPYNLTHTNYTFYSYGGTNSPNLQLTAQFSTTTDVEHRYTRGVLHFLRSVTKMYYGLNEGTPSAGTPPPVLRFSSHGAQIFNNVPVVVTNFASTFDDNIDMVTYDGISLPAIMVISIGMGVTVSPDKQKLQFSKSSFISGNAYSQGFI